MLEECKSSCLFRSSGNLSLYHTTSGVIQCIDVTVNHWCVEIWTNDFWNVNIFLFWTNDFLPTYNPYFLIVIIMKKKRSLIWNQNGKNNKKYCGWRKRKLYLYQKVPGIYSGNLKCKIIHQNHCSLQNNHEFLWHCYRSE